MSELISTDLPCPTATKHSQSPQTQEATADPVKLAPPPVATIEGFIPTLKKCNNRTAQHKFYDSIQHFKWNITISHSIVMCMTVMFNFGVNSSFN